MGEAQKPTVTKEEIKVAHDFWVHFTKMTTWSILAMIGLLAILAMTLL